MRCPRLKELLFPPKGKTGWPWTEESSQVPEAMSDGQPWPRISIVTPSYNQGQFIEETIRSVLLQGYPDLEYIIIDGGSTDGSVDIIRKYERWLTYWVSETDRGQSHAINKGLRITRGEIIGILNSDDIYFEERFKKVSNFFVNIPQTFFVHGKGVYINEKGEQISDCQFVFEGDYETLRSFDFILSQSTFFRRELFSTIGYLDEKLHFVMDWEYFLRIAKRYKLWHISEKLGKQRVHKHTKTWSKNPRRIEELIKVSYNYGGLLNPTYVYLTIDNIFNVLLGRANYLKVLLSYCRKYVLAIFKLIYKKKRYMKF